MLKYYAFRIAILTVAHLPVKIGYFIACLVGDLVYLLAGRSRNIVSQNLSRVPEIDMDGRRLRESVHGVFRNAAKNYFDLLQIPRFDLDYLEKRVTIHGWHHFERALTEGRGVVIATAHIGNFDLVAQVLAARSLKLTILAEPLEPQCLFRLVTGLRQSHGLCFLPVSFAGLKEVLRSLKRGEAVALACDRNIKGNGLKLTFLGEETKLPAGVISLALKTGALVIPAFSIRQPDNHFAVYVEPPLRFARSADGQQQERERMQLVTAIMEKYIKWHPEQWVVFKPVWSEVG